MTVLCLICAVVTFTLFGLATDHHFRKHRGHPLVPRKQRRLRRAAWAGVAACGVLAFAGQGAVYGAMLWIGALSFGAAAAFLALNLVPARVGGARR